MGTIKDFFIKGSFFFSKRVVGRLRNQVRIILLRFRGAKIGRNVYIGRCWFIWPHKVSIGRDSIIEHNVYFKFDGPYSRQPSITIGNKTFIGNACEFNIADSISIGNTCLIASGCKFVDHDHGIEKYTTINLQNPTIASIIIEDDVWLGLNVIVLKGVRIRKGAVVAAGAVVTKDVGEYEIIGGIPARLIRKRI